MINTAEVCLPAGLSRFNRGTRQGGDDGRVANVCLSASAEPARAPAGQEDSTHRRTDAAQSGPRADTPEQLELPIKLVVV